MAKGQLRIPSSLVVHVGDGNFHIGYLVDTNIPAKQLNHQMVDWALMLGGTRTGQHGKGLCDEGIVNLT